MVGQYEKYRENIKDIFHAVRVQSGTGQAELAKRLGISQGTVSKLEKGTLTPDASTFAIFCETFDIPFDSLVSGNIDTMRKASPVYRDELDGVKFPEKYKKFATFNMRYFRPLYKLLLMNLGEKNLVRVLRGMGMKNSYFFFLDNQCNLNMFIDLCNIGEITKEVFAQLYDKKLNNLWTHGKCHPAFEKEADNPISLLKTYLKKSVYYECFFDKKIVSLGNNFMNVEYAPSIKNNLKDPNPQHIDLIFNYNKSFLKSLTTYGCDFDVKMELIGDSRCIYKILT